MRAIALLCALGALGGITSIASTRAGAAERVPAARAPATAAHGASLVAIGHYRQVTWRWQRVMGAARTPSSFTALRSPDPAYRRWVLTLWRGRAHRVQRKAASWLADRVQDYQARAAHWERVMGLQRGPLRQTASSLSPSLRDRERLMKHWRKRAHRLERRALHPPYESAWRCIHSYEGSWTDRGAPYYGGLQMDIAFQRHYGSYLLATKGTADHWSPAEQMWVATRALRSGRGFYPWPNTARACGLI